VSDILQPHDLRLSIVQLQIDADADRELLITTCSGAVLAASDKIKLATLDVFCNKVGIIMQNDR